MKKLTLLFLTFSMISLLFAQKETRIKVRFPPGYKLTKSDSLYFSSPQVKKDYNYPGSYEISANLTRVRINKGEATTLNVHITGYGKIGGSKIYFNTSAPIFDSSSQFFTSLWVDTSDSTKPIARFGIDTGTIGSAHALAMTMQGMKRGFWNYNSIYLDTEEDTSDLSITTENNLDPPLKFILKCKTEDVEAGDYTCNLYFTYFNSEQWKTSKISIPVHINSIWERYPWIAILIGSIALAIALIQLTLSSRTFYIQFFLRPKKTKQEATLEKKENAEAHNLDLSQTTSSVVENNQQSIESKSEETNNHQIEGHE